MVQTTGPPPTRPTPPPEPEIQDSLKDIKGKISRLNLDERNRVFDSLIRTELDKRAESIKGLEEQLEEEKEKYEDLRKILSGEKRR